MRKWLFLILIFGLLSGNCASGRRIGAVCKDGTTTSATGKGACSHHGGVDHWLYE